MCVSCKGKDRGCDCRGKITTSDGKSPQSYVRSGKIINQKGAFGRKTVKREMQDAKNN